MPTTGPQGNRGFGLQFNWDGTALGVKVENEPSYTYQDLQGPQGIQGEQGEPGDVTNAVSELERTNWNAAWGDHSDQGYLRTIQIIQVYHPFSGLSIF